MITTALVSASEATARPILETAGAHGVPFFKPGYYRYAFADVRTEIERRGAALRGLAELARAVRRRSSASTTTPATSADRCGTWCRSWTALDPRVGRLLLRRAPRRRGRGRRRLARRAQPGGAAPEDGRGQGLLLGEGPRRAGSSATARSARAWWTGRRSSRRSRGADSTGPVSLHLEYEIPGATPRRQAGEHAGRGGAGPRRPEGGASRRPTRAASEDHPARVPGRPGRCRWPRSRGPARRHAAAPRTSASPRSATGTRTTSTARRTSSAAAWWTASRSSTCAAASRRARGRARGASAR